VHLVDGLVEPDVHPVDDVDAVRLRIDHVVLEPILKISLGLNLSGPNKS
jgi:hypothetical protein